MARRAGLPQALAARRRHRPDRPAQRRSRPSAAPRMPNVTLFSSNGYLDY